MPKYVSTPTDDLSTLGPVVATRLTAGDEPYRTLTVRPMTPTIGAEIEGLGGLELGALDDATVAELRRALVEWKVIVVRGHHLDRDAQRRLAALWGPADEHPFFKYTMPAQTDPDVSTFAKDEQTVGRENLWHHDNTYLLQPSFGAVLRAVEVPDVGGDTLWADMAAAYETLPDDLKAEIDPLFARHDWMPNFGRQLEPEIRDRLRPGLPAVEHPVVRINPDTGARMLFVNTAFTQHIVGVEPSTSDRLLRSLYRHVMRPEFQCRLRWTPGTIAIWDNRSCQHYAASDYHPKRRVMDRISISGDLPFGPAGSSRAVVDDDRVLAG